MDSNIRIDPRVTYRNRIDILKRLGSKLYRPMEYDTNKYVRLDNGMLVKRETIKAGKLYVQGKKVQL